MDLLTFELDGTGYRSDGKLGADMEMAANPVGSAA